MLGSHVVLSLIVLSIFSASMVDGMHGWNTPAPTYYYDDVQDSGAEAVIVVTYLLLCLCPIFIAGVAISCCRQQRRRRQQLRMKQNQMAVNAANTTVMMHQPAMMSVPHVVSVAHPARVAHVATIQQPQLAPMTSNRPQMTKISQVRQFEAGTQPPSYQAHPYYVPPNNTTVIQEPIYHQQGEGTAVYN